MTPFDRCLSVTLGHEGGDIITDNPDDPGGLTRWGISQRAHPDVDVRHLTRDGAAAIYRRDYWQPMRCDDLPLPVALCAFDCAVNMGVRASSRLLQSAVGSPADGIVGPRTLAALHRHPVSRVIRRLNVERAQRYMELGGWRTFGRGWIARTIDIAVTAAEWDTETD